MQVKRLMQILENLPYDAEVLVAVDAAQNEVNPIWNIICKFYENSEKIIIIPDDMSENNNE